MKLRHDWKWIVSHAWSIRLIFLAFLLSAGEVVMPLFIVTHRPTPLFAIILGLVTGGAFVSRLIAQKREIGVVAE